MVIIKAQGGLGNQLFQYALYKKFESLEIPVCIDVSIYDTKNEKRTWLLDNLVEDISYSTLKNKKKLADDYLSFLGLVKRKIAGRKKTHFYEENSFEFYEEIFEKNNVYLDGYWQSEKYFWEVRNSIIDSIHFPVSMGRYSEYQNQIVNSNAVSIHVRRGDYLWNQDMYVDLSATDYYERAIKYICDRVATPRFFVFSDDIDWCKRRFEGVDVPMSYIDNTSYAPYDDLQLMSLCQHNIIANSSFSWWGAWLNENKDKIVVAPEYWSNVFQNIDVVGRGWIKI